MAIRAIDPKGKIFLNETTLRSKGVKYHERMYFTIEDYQYEGGRLLWVTINMILDIAAYLNNRENVTYKITLSDTDISNEVRKSVREYQDILDANQKE
jgi:hypothetical protein